MHVEVREQFCKFCRVDSLSPCMCILEIETMSPGYSSIAHEPDSWQNLLAYNAFCQYWRQPTSSWFQNKAHCTSVVFAQRLIIKPKLLHLQEPFEHESLLLNRKDHKLTKAEKKAAKKSYEEDKRTSVPYTRPSYAQYYPASDQSLTSIPAFSQRNWWVAEGRESGWSRPNSFHSVPVQLKGECTACSWAAMKRRSCSSIRYQSNSAAHMF